MVDPKEKKKPEFKTRTPKKVTPSGIFDNLRRLPHPMDEIIGVAPAPDSQELKSIDNQETLPSPSSHPTPSSHPSPSPIAPMRDFMKVPNSLTRETIPSGVFSGKSKQMYDYLYSLTRGAITPKRTVRVTREQLMKGAGIGAKVTLEQNIARLRQARLIDVRVIGGIQGGNEYTVRTPEEVAILGTLPSPSSLADNGENIATLERLETRVASHGVNADTTQVSTNNKTLFKTKEFDDDEAYADFLRLLKEAVREVTGMDSASSESQRWKELAELLIEELKIAAARTTISSVPAFLTEHLRRRLVTGRGKQKKDTSTLDSRIAPKVDASACPDCRGTGFWEPGGTGKGVAKCSHKGLHSGRAEQGESESDKNQVPAE